MEKLKAAYFDKPNFSTLESENRIISVALFPRFRFGTFIESKSQTSHNALCV